MDMPQVGDVWFRKGRRREVVDVYADKDGVMRVQYGYRRILLTSWLSWARRAGLLYRDGKAVWNE
jgi:hypothetical protein